MCYAARLITQTHTTTNNNNDDQDVLERACPLTELLPSNKLHQQYQQLSSQLNLPPPKGSPKPNSNPPPKNTRPSPSSPNGGAKSAPQAFNAPFWQGQTTDSADTAARRTD